MNGLSQAIGIGHCLVDESAMLIFLSEKVSTGPTQMKGAPFVFLAHAALHRRSIKQSQSRASRAGNGPAADRDFVDSTQKRKSTEGTPRYSNTSFRLPQALIRARKQEVAPTSDSRMAEMETFFNQTPLAATYLSKEKAPECTQCSTADPSYRSAGDVQLKRMWHRVKMVLNLVRY